uniref:Uncharacterized protein n=1 Tax=Anguilla anguilla TaxID=7936 RepID=A0A0E9PGL8_ANGAN
MKLSSHCINNVIVNTGIVLKCLNKEGRPIFAVTNMAARILK